MASPICAQSFQTLPVVKHVMPPYGTPTHPYVTMYPPGGMYGHPSIPPGSYPYSPYAMPSPNGMTEAFGNTTEGDGKQSEVKEKLPIKRSRGSLGSLNIITGKNSGASANGAYSKSGESASDGSSEGSDANSQNNSGSGGSANGPRDGSVGTPPDSASQQTMTAAGVPAPPTNLNIGMDYWGAPTSASTPVHGVVAPVSRDGCRSQPWLQDDREVTRQRRKQNKLRSQCEELTSENTSLKLEAINQTVTKTNSNHSLHLKALTWTRTSRHQSNR
ncbi:LOW QUALITY PROTEIN: hypothetical protein HID58_016066, partial [Brassica napus]